MSKGRAEEEEQQVDMETGYTESLTAQGLETGRKLKGAAVEHKKDTFCIDLINLNNAPHSWEMVTDGTT